LFQVVAGWLICGFAVVCHLGDFALVRDGGGFAVLPRITCCLSMMARLAAFGFPSGAAVLGSGVPRHCFRRYSFFAGGSGNTAFRNGGLPEASLDQVPRYRPPQKKEHAPAQSLIPLRARQGKTGVRLAGA
jgi:hypothetical protein